MQRSGSSAGGEQQRREVVERAPQLGGVVGDRDRVQVDDAEERLAALLALDVLADRADVVAEVLASGRLDAREDAQLARLLKGPRARPAASPRATSSRRRTGVV